MADDTSPAARLATLRTAVESCAPHEIKRAGILLREGATLLATQRNAALWEGWCRWLVRDAGPAWRRALDESDAADAIDGVLNSHGWRKLCVVSEALNGATAVSAALVARLVKGWDAAQLVASLNEDADDAERFADAACRLPRRLATLLKGKSPLREEDWLAAIADGALHNQRSWRVLATILEKTGHAALVAQRWVLMDDDGARLDVLSAGTSCRYAVALVQATDDAHILDAMLTTRLRRCPVLRSKWTDEIIVGRLRLDGKAALAVYLAKRANLYGEALASVSKKWQDVAFLKSVSEERRAFLATSVLALLALSDAVDMDVNTTLAGIVGGVSAHLDLNDEKDRARAMLVGDAFGTLVGRAPDFGPLLSEEDRRWTRRGLSTVPLAAVHPAFRAAPHYFAQATVVDAPVVPAPAEAPKQSKKRSPDDCVASGSESDDEASVESATTLSDDGLEPYDLADDGADLKPVQRPKYLRDLLKMINEGTQEELARERLQMALGSCADLVRSRPADLKDIARDLAHAVLSTENRFDLEDFCDTSRSSLAALTATRPVEVVRYLQLSFFDRELGLNKRLDALQAMVDGAYELAGRGRLADTDVDLPEGTSRALLGVDQRTTRSRRLLLKDASDAKILERTRRWGYRRSAPAALQPNLFARHAAALFFFPLLRGVADHWSVLEKRHPHHSTVLRARAVHALACFLDCASSAPGGGSLASHLLAFAWKDVRSDDAALRRAARGAALTALAWRPCDDGGGALALLAGGVCADLPSPQDVRALAYDAREDPDVAARRLALALGELCPAGY